VTALVVPRQATARDLARRSTGRSGAFVGQLHSRPWLPWQHEAAGVIGETLPSGRMAYPIVVIMVPRKCGKTTFLFDVLFGRCLLLPDYR